MAIPCPPQLQGPRKRCRRTVTVQEVTFAQSQVGFAPARGRFSLRAGARPARVRLRSGLSFAPSDPVTVAVRYEGGGPSRRFRWTLPDLAR